MSGSLSKALSLLLCATIIWASPLSASTEEPEPLTPFTATYEIDWDGGISLSGKTVRKLQLDDNKHWQFESKASAMFASIYESSLFDWSNETLLPIKYTFERSVLGKKRQAEVEFDWNNLSVTNQVENKPWQMDIQRGVQDKISYQLLLQQEIAQGKTEFNYSVADGGHLKEYLFKVDGTEKIDAPIGSFDAIRVKRIRKEGSDRQTYIWFAPELNYQIIKLYQIEKKGKEYTLLLKSLEQ